MRSFGSPALEEAMAYSAEFHSRNFCMNPQPPCWKSYCATYSFCSRARSSGDKRASALNSTFGAGRTDGPGEGSATMAASNAANGRGSM
jgi:hypothetical protein